MQIKQQDGCIITAWGGQHGQRSLALIIKWAMFHYTPCGEADFNSPLGQQSTGITPTGGHNYRGCSNPLDAINLGILIIPPRMQLFGGS